MIRFHNVSKVYPGGREALVNVSLHVEAGAMAFITGHSGAGKSTLLRLLGGTGEGDPRRRSPHPEQSVDELVGVEYP